MTKVSIILRESFSKFDDILLLPALIEHENEVSLQKWRDELGRIRVWAANIGAHQTGTLSLDYRLRDASTIKNQTVNILKRLLELFADLEEVLNEDGESDMDIEEDDFDQYNDLTDTDINKSEIQHIYETLVETVTQLYQITMAIRRPAQHDRLMGTRKLDAEPFKFWARQHVSHKYPHAEEFIVDRLSSAMARQRAILKYRERHHEKLSQGLSDEEESVDLSETLATTLNQKRPQSRLDDSASNDGLSQTSYASTLMNGMETVAIPPMPQEGADGAPFECPYCFFIITVGDSHAWARHIFGDLRPYVCVFPDCPNPQKLYDSQRDWYMHIKSQHKAGDRVNGSFDCMICQKKQCPVTTLKKHVGRHLQELALFVLPRVTAEDVEQRDKTYISGGRDDSGDAHLDGGIGCRKCQHDFGSCPKCRNKTESTSFCHACTDPGLREIESRRSDPSMPERVPPLVSTLKEYVSGDGRSSLFIPDWKFDSRQSHSGDYMGSVLPEHRLPEVNAQHADTLEDAPLTSMMKYKCLECDECYTPKRGVFSRHVNDQHHPKCTFVCPESSCDVRKSRKYQLKDHLMLRHRREPTDEELATCRIDHAPPTHCPLCLVTLRSWKDFDHCYILHCSFEVSAPEPLLPVESSVQDTVQAED